MVNNRYLIKRIRENSKALTPVKTKLRDEGKINQRIKCVIFDIYGTLFVSGSGDISVSEKVCGEKEIKKVLVKYGILKHPDNVYNDYISAIKDEHERLRSLGVRYPEVKIELIWKNILNINVSKAKRIAVEYETLVNPVWPMQGALDLLYQLKLRKVKLGIISNAQFYTPMIFKALMGKSLPKLGFDRKLIFFSYKYGFSKPSLELFNLAVKKLKDYGIKPEETVYIGNDILNDIKPASMIGFKTVLFAGDKRSLRLREKDKECRNVKPDVIVTSLERVLDLLNF